MANLTRRARLIPRNGAASLPLPLRLRTALAHPRAELLVLLALLAGIGLVQATNMLHWPNIQFDEGTYVSNAWAVEHGASPLHLRLRPSAAQPG